MGSGIKFAKDTKITVLSTAHKYIRTLKEYSCKIEKEKSHLIHQLHVVINRCIGLEGARNRTSGIWKLGTPDCEPKLASNLTSNKPQKQLNESHYYSIFQHSSEGMAIAILDGKFVDFNLVFLQLSGYTRQEMSSMTIFNIINPSDIDHAYYTLSKMIPPQHSSLKSNEDESLLSTSNT